MASRAFPSCAVVAAAAAFFVAAGELRSVDDYVRGDANVDWKIDLSDVVFINQWIFQLWGSTPPCLGATDTNNDGINDLADSVMLFNYLFYRSPSSLPAVDPGDTSCDSYALVTPPPGPDFALGFSGPENIQGQVGGEMTFDVYATLTTSNSPGSDGAQGWSFGMDITGGTIDSISLKGVTVDTIYDEQDCQLEPLPPLIHHDHFDLDLKDSWGKFYSKATNLGRNGAVSAVILGYCEKKVLQPSGTQNIAKITVKRTLAESQDPVVLSFRDGFKSSASQPVTNTITLGGYSYAPALGQKTIPIELLQPPVFNLDFEGLPSRIAGAPGEEKTFEVFCRLTSANLISEDGPNGWAISMGIDGGEINDIAIDGVLVNTIYDSPPIHYENYVVDLDDAYQKFAYLAFHKDDPSRKGAFSAIVLHEVPGRLILHPNARDRIARLTVKVTIPEDRGQVTLYYEDGFKSDVSQPVDNRIYIDVNGYDPQFGSCTIPIVAVESSPLEFDVPESFFLTGSQPGKYFKLAAPLGTSATVSLSDPDSSDANALYLRWGDLPETDLFDLAADARDQAEQTLVIPYFRSETAYILVQASRIKGGASDVTLLAKSGPLVLGKASASFQGLGGSGRLDMAVSGAGFRPSTVFSLKHQGSGEIRLASEKTIVSSDRAEVAFQLSGAPVGKYDLRAVNPGPSEAILEGAFEVLDTRRGSVLQVELSSPDRCRYDRLGRVALKYSNTGDEEMTAPLFKVVGPVGSELRLETEEEFQGSAIQVLGVDPAGVAGKLAPLASGEIPIIFRSPSETEARFEVYLFSPNRDDFVDWESIDGPPDMDPADWKALRLPLSAKLGATWIEYREELARRANRLARRGVDASSVREIFRFAAREALGRPSSAAAGRVRSAATGAPLEGMTVLALKAGEVRSSAVSGKEGSYNLDWLEGGGSYLLRLVDASGTADVTLPIEGDRLGVDLLVTAQVNGLKPRCPNCDESGLPPRPFLPPEGLFTRISDRSLAVISSWDPNEKEGPVGEDVGDDEEIVYSIYFENLPAATAWAQKVEVTDKLDPDLDWSTFRLRDMRLGGETLISLDLREEGHGLSVPSDGYGASTVFEKMGPSGEWLLHASCEFDPLTGLARWTFQTLDPSTGMLPNSFLYPDAGFLPPNDSTQRGEGQVVFSVKPKADAEDGSEIRNDATIAFDFLPPLTTNAVKSWIRRSLQVEAPRNPFPGSGTDHPLEIDTILIWQGKAKSYDLYLWEDGQPEQRVAEGITVKSFRPADLEEGTTYHWRVEAEGQTGPSEEWTFRTVDAPVVATVTIAEPSPASGAVDQPRLPLLSCVATGAPAYDLYLWPHGGPRTAIARGLKAINHRPRKALDHGYNYDWQVVAVLRDGVTQEGPVWTFRTMPALFKRGDPNSDGSPNLTDAIFALAFFYLGGKEPECLESLEVNGDGSTNITDVIALLNYLFLGGDPPEEPFLTCGLYSGNLGCKSYLPCGE